MLNIGAVRFNRKNPRLCDGFLPIAGLRLTPKLSPIARCLTDHFFEYAVELCGAEATEPGDFVDVQVISQEECSNLFQTDGDDLIVQCCAELHEAFFLKPPA